MLAAEIEPANPPLPTCWYLPFQLAPAGIHTSKWTLDRAPGRTVAATRHRSNGALVVPETTAPAVYDWASVIVVLGSESCCIRSEQASAAAGAAWSMTAAAASDGATYFFSRCCLLGESPCEHSN